MGTMLLRFRQNSFACIALLALGTSTCNTSQLVAKQEPSSANKPNSLRIGDPSGAAKPTSPTNFGRTTLVAPQDAQTTGVNIPQDVVKPLAADSMEIETLTQIELGMKIAAASLSHATPFLWWMAGPTSNLFVDRFAGIETEDEESSETEPTESEASQRETSDHIAMSLEDDALEATAANEPPRLIPAVNTGFAKLPSAEEEADNEDDSEKKAPVAISRPTPRTVRIPFEKKDDEYLKDPIANEVQPKALHRDRESQRDQEEPKLIQKENASDKDDQGVDALKASKPIINRREIRIEDPSNQGISVAPIISSKPIDSSLAKRLQRTEACLSHYLNNPESTSVRSPWAVMHALLAYGGEYELIHNQSRVNAIGWMCHNGTCRTQRMFTPNPRGFTPNVGDGVQGHEGQFLAILAQSNVPLNYPIQIGTSKFTVEDLVRHEMSTCKEKSELTFKLIGLSYYLDSNKQWRANDGKQWSLQKLIQEELAQPIVGAACGGVHRLMGFSFSIRQRQLQAQPINGQYARAAKFVREYIDYTWQLQNPDGSFSTSWYEGRANDPNEERKVQTTGHMLEWLMFTLPDEEVNTARVGKSIDFLLSKIYDKREHKWPIGPRGHATRAIALYQDRIQEAKSKPTTSTAIQSATKPSSSSSNRK